MHIRPARAEDLPALVRLLAQDQLGRARERSVDPLPDGYRRAFEAISANPDHLLLVGERDGEVVATLQLTLLTYLTYEGGTRAQIEAVRVDRDHRGTGLGRELLRWAIDEARRRGCHLVQLTTDKRRAEAHAFYESLGFVATHEGMKLHLA